MSMKEVSVIAIQDLVYKRAGMPAERGFQFAGINYAVKWAGMSIGKEFPFLAASFSRQRRPVSVENMR